VDKYTFESTEFDFRDPTTVEIHINTESGQITLELSKKEVQELLKGFNQ
jgi:hypothetical protein